MKRIVCPVDFSKSSLNGLEYAANIAKVMKASLSLLYVRTSIWPEAIQLERMVNESNEDLGARLETLCNEVSKEFGVSCRYHVESTTLTLEESLANNTNNTDLVVMGTNGADNYYQYFFGSNSFQLIEKTNCPALVIPEDCIYHPVKLVLYAYDPDTNPIFMIDQLKKLALAMGAGIKVLHIIEESPSEKVKREMEVLTDAVRIRAPKGIDWSFSSYYAQDVTLALHDWMDKEKADVLALSFHHRSIIEELFNENVIKKTSAMANYPMFVFWR
jgi:nucleotide-binding universal stress UspA family protein